MAVRQLIYSNTKQLVEADIGVLLEPSQTTEALLVLRGLVGQTADIFTVKDSSNSEVFSINDTGNIFTAGDLTVNGTITTINSTVVDIADRIIHLNHTTGANDPVPTLITGLSIHRGAVASVDRDHAGLFWKESESTFYAALNTAGDDSTLGSTVIFKANQFISDVTTGTAPLTVTSTTKVTNLHVDRVDFVSFSGLTADRTKTLSDANDTIAEYNVANSFTATNSYLSGGAGTPQTFTIPHLASTTGLDNTIAGEGSGTALTTGFSNTFIGSRCGDGVTTGAQNIFMGHNAGGSALGVAQNNCVLIGFNAGAANQSGDNVFIGYGVGADVTTGSENVFIGSSAGASTLGQTQVRNVFVGAAAGLQNRADNNTAVGYAALLSNTTGTQSTCLGFAAGRVIVTADDLTAIGYRAAEFSTVAITAVGSQSLSTNSTGTGNTAFGLKAGFTITTGSNNVFIGDNAGGSGIGFTQTDCTLVGYHAGLNNTANGNTGVGSGALAANTTGTQNTAVGVSAGGAIVTGINGTFIGFNAGLLATGTANTIIGSLAGDALTTGTSNTLIGTEAGTAITTGAGQVFIGYRSGRDTTSPSDGNVGVGVQTLQFNTDGIRNTAVGHQAANTSLTANDITAVGYLAAAVSTVTVTAIGSGALDALTTGARNTAVGVNAGGAITTSADCTFIGHSAGILVTGVGNTIIGSLAGDGVTTGQNNVFIGLNAGGAATGTTQSNCVFIGTNAGDVNTASENVGIGSGVLGNNTSGTRNTAVGNGSGLLIATANDLSAFGNDAAFWSTVAITAIGSSALKNNSTGIENTAVGISAGLTNTVGTGSTYIGYNSGTLATGSQNTCLGALAGNLISTGTDNVIIGYNADVGTNTFSGSIIMGSGAVNIAAAQFVAGSSTFPMTTVAFGNGIQHTAPTSYTIQGTNTSAGTSNTAGGSITIAAGVGTGTGISGSFIVKVAPAGASGSTQNSLISAFTVNTNGIASVYKGANFASAAALVPTGNVFHVTGTTTITSITTTNMISGTYLTLIFDGIATLTNGSPIFLFGEVNFVSTANDTLTLVYDGTNFYEVCRSVN